MNVKKTILFTVFGSLLSATTVAQSESGSTEAFNALDKNLDGTISAAEAKGTWLASLFQQLDVNNDGVVSRAEYDLRK